MDNFYEFKNYFLIWLYKLREFFGNHYSYELEGFSFSSGKTSIIYKVKGKYHTYKKSITDAYDDHLFLFSFSPLSIKQICKQYHLERSILDEEHVTENSKNTHTFIPKRLIAKKYRFLPLLAMLYIAILIIAILLSPDLVKVGFFTEPRGILLFPLTYLIADIISEVYGYQMIRLIIWSSLACLIVVTIGISISLALPEASNNTRYHEYMDIFGNMPRLLLANGLSIVISDFSNAYLFSKLKIITHGRYLWLRLVGASALGEMTYSIIWILVFFFSQLSINQMLSMSLQNYFFKMFYSIFFIPFTYLVSTLLKKVEGSDIYDYNISYNIFSTDFNDIDKKY